jgi:GNAT superfamily N-acetyltransferase
VAGRKNELIGSIHRVMHEDIIDGGLNSFVTCFYVTPEFRNKGIGSKLLDRAMNDALGRGAVGIEASAANPDARRLYETHHFRQFIGNRTMGEVFLELDMGKYKRSQKLEVSREPIRKQGHDKTTIHFLGLE